ncbi:sulfite exporter TauE/SafE family protein [Nocardiopsis coralliicola]
MADPAQFIEWSAVFAAGFLAGAMNVMVGAGTLVSFPILVFLGIPPLTATIANTIGIVPGSAAGVLVYRSELRARRAAVRTLLPASAAGGILGALLLLHLSAAVFSAVIPWLIAAGTLLVLLGPAIRGRVARVRGAGGGRADGPLPAFPSRPSLLASVFGAFALGVYGGYFSAAQGILLIGLLGITTTLHMQELNAIKNLTVAAVNVIAAVVFLVVSPDAIAWQLVGLIAAGSALGGAAGGRIARRLPPAAFRVFVAAVGAVAVAALLVDG